MQIEDVLQLNSARDGQPILSAGGGQRHVSLFGGECYNNLDAHHFRSNQVCRQIKTDESMLWETEN